MRPVDADRIVRSIKAQGDIVRLFGIEELTSMTNMIEEGFLQEIENAPTLDVVPVRKGKWIPWKYHDGFRCEYCNEPVYNKRNFCPECGADMREESE